ncbi:unnamed protein product [Thelazia callipaeda]|uniref:ZP domain-containing protein n=1 Tax=Thelazia callipaeda TaxID=103827 RepID=A0A0N5CXS9_THECL|nr:unnamed protein product [Thelazia callipaeda]
MIEYVSSIAIDNDIIGDPDIECLDEEIRIFVKTRKIFNGRIYAKGKADTPACSKDDFAQERTKKPHMVLQFGTCGMKSLRSVDPRGMYYGVTVVISFHTIFITKVDQAFHVKCFFEEASRGLTAALGVSMIATTEVEARHAIPGCSYSIHASSIDDLDAGRPAGPLIKYARVGDRVLHQWHCDDEMFGILINNCYVTDGFSKRAEVIDSNGCSIDPILITGIRYSADLQRAYGESMVFKFADRPGVWFFCQIQMCMKKAGMCNGITPPTCSSTKKTGTTNFLPDPEWTDISDETRASDVVMVTAQPSINEKLKQQKLEAVMSEYEMAPTKNEYFDAKDNQHESTRIVESQVTYNNEESTTMVHHSKEDSWISRTQASVILTTKPVLEILTSDTDEYDSEQKTDSREVEKSVEQKVYQENAGDVTTIPLNLNDLLANLPDGMNADSLQRIFYDSVQDRRALMRNSNLKMNKARDKQTQGSKADARKKFTDVMTNNNFGDKLKSVQVSWGSSRLSDQPLSETFLQPQIQTDNILSISSKAKPDQYYTDSKQVYTQTTAPLIAGQLIIYDLDEESPTASELYRKEAVTTKINCAISRQGLLILISCLGSISATLFIITFFLYLRLSKYTRYYKEPPLTSTRLESSTAHIKKFSTNFALR